MNIAGLVNVENDSSPEVSMKAFNREREQMVKNFGLVKAQPTWRIDSLTDHHSHYDPSGIIIC